MGKPVSPGTTQLSEDEAQRLESLIDRLQTESAQLRADYAALEQRAATSQPDLGSSVSSAAGVTRDHVFKGSIARAHLSAESSGMNSAFVDASAAAAPVQRLTKQQQQELFGPGFASDARVVVPARSTIGLAPSRI